MIRLVIDEPALEGRVGRGASRLNQMMREAGHDEKAFREFLDDVDADVEVQRALAALFAKSLRHFLTQQEK